MGYQQLRIRKESKPKLDQLCKQEGRSQMDIIDSVLSYFLDNKCSPFDTPQSAANELKKLRETVISFIRQQEKKTLLPMKIMIEEIAKDMGSYKTSSHEQKIEVPKNVKKKVIKDEGRSDSNIERPVDEGVLSSLKKENESLKKDNDKLRKKLSNIKDKVTTKRLPTGSTHYVIEADISEIKQLLNL